MTATLPGRSIRWASRAMPMVAVIATVACGRMDFDAIPQFPALVQAPDGASGDAFGDSVALSAHGDTLAIGAHGQRSAAIGIGDAAADTSAPDSGAVYVFVRSNRDWREQAYIKASNTQAGDRFGDDVALSADGSTLVVSSPLEDSVATGVNGDQADDPSVKTDSGAAFVFVRDDNSRWTQQAYLKPSNTGAGDHFGFGLAVSADGNTLAIGASFEDSSAVGIDGDAFDEAATDSGSVYVFHREGSNWSQEAYVKPSDTAMGDRFGYNLALSADGNGLAVGAFGKDGGAGAVYMFSRTEGLWSQQAHIAAPRPTDADEFGKGLSLSASGDVLAVSAPSEDGRATGIDGDPNATGAAASGAVYMFERDRVSGTWNRRAYIKASNTEAGDLFGQDVTLSADGSMLVVGAIGEDSAASGIDGNGNDNAALDSGAVYVFRHDATWVQEAYVKPSSTAAGASFGFDVALSLSGDVLAVGARGSAGGVSCNGCEDGSASRGAVYALDW